MLLDVCSHHLLEEKVELTEVAEYDVATEIPREARAVHDGRGMPAGGRRALEEEPILMPVPHELSGTGEPTRTGADDDDVLVSRSPHRVHRY